MKWTGLASAGLVTSSWGKTGESLFLHEGGDEFEDLRQLFNSDLSRKPAMIAACQDEVDVQLAVAKAIKLKLPISVKSGGHCFIGSSVNDGSMLVDLSQYTGMNYDRGSQKLVAQPGVKLGKMYDRLLSEGRLLPAGSCSGVALGGLTLGGGYGLFARQYGLTCDHLRRVRMVNGKGEIVDSDDDEDLLWACRGGGNGNFGVITSMEFDTQKAPEKLGAQRFKTKGLSEKGMVEVIESWFTIAAELPDPIFSAMVLNGSQVTVLLTSSYSTSGPAFQRAAKRLKDLGLVSNGALNTPIAKALRRYYGRPKPLPFYNASGGFYKGYENLEGKTEEIVRRVQQNPGLIFQVNTLGGAISRGTDSAYAHRKFPFLGEIQAYWRRPEDKLGLVNQVDAIQKIIQAQEHYRNYPSLKIENYSTAYYGAKLSRLQEIKAKFDPDNIFCHAQSLEGR